ncbi:SMI1/KNR4 family protein [Planomonospora sp. ID82291]|uniref:SMI1/KNR4 family protein n=1 Tax=Planomonospora sp. ID82291 TaxID=2738136 RepID=UPI0018C36252|nr:SMI1/KNR4 family protein [Planomonospora sp. ID82291]MBG0814249.1 SMI1/KNR4 family protein [Planomonospora sp. ID82291]
MATSDTPRYPWDDLLRTVNDRAQKYFAEYRAIPPEQRGGPDDGFGRAAWLGAPGAGEAEIARHEERLGMRLPPSYREFLQVANGWDEYSHSSLRLMPLAEVGWTRDVDPELAGIWDHGKSALGPQDLSRIGEESVSDSLCISECIEGQVYLLNPYVVGEDGEWEAWDFASWHPGEVRYRSFWDLMQREFNSYLS